MFPVNIVIRGWDVTKGLLTDSNQGFTGYTLGTHLNWMPPFYYWRQVEVNSHRCSAAVFWIICFHFVFIEFNYSTNSKMLPLLCAKWQISFPTAPKCLIYMFILLVCEQVDDPALTELGCVLWWVPVASSLTVWWQDLQQAACTLCMCVHWIWYRQHGICYSANLILYTR